MNKKSQGWLANLFEWGKRRQSSTGENLYASAVNVARQPVFYQDFGVKDTVDGRFDTLSLIVVLVMRKLIDGGNKGRDISQQLFDSMFADMDLSLREMGAGDIGVSKRVRVMAEAFMGRLDVYVDALDNEDRTALAAALQRNLFRDDLSIDPIENGCVDYVFALASEIANLSTHGLLLGNLDLSLTQ
jgi:cytochrome b pre-mRNA-processing protein 3